MQILVPTPPYIHGSLLQMSFCHQKFSACVKTNVFIRRVANVTTEFEWDLCVDQREHYWDREQGCQYDTMTPPLDIRASGWKFIKSVSNNKGWFSEFLFFCFLTITTSNLHQIQKVRSVFKSAGSKDFKTVPTFDNWPSGSCENWG